MENVDDAELVPAITPRDTVSCVDEPERIL